MNENSNINETKEDVKYNNKIYKRMSKKDNVIIFDPFAINKKNNISNNGKINNLESQKESKQI